MGVNCRLVTDKGSTWMGRLYHYTNYLQAERVYKADDFIRIIGTAIEQGDTFSEFQQAIDIALKCERIVVISEESEGWDGIHRLAYRESKE